MIHETNYELSNGLACYSSLKQMLESNQDEVGQEIINQYLETYAKNEELATELVQYDSDINAVLDRIDSETERLKTIKSMLEERKESVRKGIIKYMNAIGAKKGFLGTHEIMISKSSELKIIDEDLIPREFIKEVVKITHSPDKMAIKKAIKSGELVEGAHIQEKQNLQVK